MRLGDMRVRASPFCRQRQAVKRNDDKGKLAPKLQSSENVIGIISVRKHNQIGEKMRMKINQLLLFVILASLTTPFALGKTKAEVRDITGCLSKGDSAHEFMRTGNDGSTWEVRSSRVVLAKHVGHTITATGVVSHAKLHNMKEDTKEMAKETGMKKSDAEHGHMKITAVKMEQHPCVAVAVSYTGGAAVARPRRSCKFPNRTHALSPGVPTPYVKVPVQVEALVAAVADKVFGFSPQVSLHVGYRSMRIIDAKHVAQIIERLERLHKFRIGKVHQV